MLSSSNNKLVLKIIFVALFLALLGELAYIFTTVNKKESSRLFVPAVATPTPTSFPIYLTSQYKGKITKLNLVNVDPAIKADKIVLSFVLEIDDEKKEDPKVFFYYRSELKHMKVTDPTGKVISYKDLKVGQTITLDQKYGQNENSYLSLTITVIN